VYWGPHILKYVLIVRIYHLASLFLPVKSSGRPAFTSTRAVVVDMSSSLPSKKSQCLELLSGSGELGLEGGGGETGRSGEGREASELSNAREMMEGDARADRV